MNDNGPRPEDYDEHYRRTMRRSRNNKIFLVIALLLPVMAIVFGSVGFFGIRHANVGTVHVHSERLGLAVLDSAGAASGDLRVAAADVSDLHIDMRNGALSIISHEEDFVQVRSGSAIRYSLGGGVLTLEENRSGALTVFVPLDMEFDSVQLYGRNGAISVIGFAAENLHVENRNGSVNVIDMVVSGDLHLETRNGNVHVNNVLADESRVRFTTRNGRVFVS